MRTSGFVPRVPEINPVSILIGSLIAAYVTVLITRNDPSATNFASLFIDCSFFDARKYVSGVSLCQRRGDAVNGLGEIGMERTALLSQEGSTTEGRARGGS